MIRKDDIVMVIAGKERGKTGKVLRILTDRDRAIVEKLNMIKRHTRPNPKQRQGGIIEKEASIHLSNLMLYCGKCQKAVRVRHQVTKGKKERVCGQCEEKVGV